VGAGAFFQVIQAKNLNRSAMVHYRVAPWLKSSSPNMGGKVLLTKNAAKKSQSSSVLHLSRAPRVETRGLSPIKYGLDAT
jgi:hypothetical protein